MRADSFPSGSFRFILVILALLTLPAVRAEEKTLWQLAREQSAAHRFSTLFTAQDVRHHLSTESGLSNAVAWCKATGVTAVFIECFRDGYRAEQPALAAAKKRFEAEGFHVSGCVTPTQVGKSSTGWKNVISCYTDQATQRNVLSIFEYAAGLFDETMIDDFWFTDCACEECDRARLARKVAIGERSYAVNGDRWEDYRCELMVQLSRDYVLAAARRVNPKASLIIKYPQWYDRFHERGYEVARQTADFHRIWVGTETRDYTNPSWGGTPQYEAYFIMRWLGRLGGAKCGGGWYDPYGTTPATYIEQARQTILGGARESLLFCYGSLLGDAGPANIEALRSHLPELLRTAREVRAREITGIAAYKPPNSHPEDEPRVFDFVGMMGLPLVPCHEFPEESAAAFFSVHAHKDPDLVLKLQRFVRSGKPVLITDGLAKALGSQVKTDAANVQILPVRGDPKSLLALDQSSLDVLRDRLCGPFSLRFKAPNRVSLYLFKDGSWVVENFNDTPVQAELNGESLPVPPRGWVCRWR